MKTKLHISSGVRKHEQTLQKSEDCPRNTTIHFWHHKTQAHKPATRLTRYRGDINWTRGRKWVWFLWDHPALTRKRSTITRPVRNVCIPTLGLWPNYPEPNARKHTQVFMWRQILRPQRTATHWRRRSWCLSVECCCCLLLACWAVRIAEKLVSLVASLFSINIDRGWARFFRAAMFYGRL